MADRRNIVLITLDSLRADHCSFMGYHRKTTPTMDKMARKGLYFEIAVPSGIATNPSMFGVHTGNYALTSAEDYNGRHWRQEFKYNTTIAEVLSKKGYSTLAINSNVAASTYFGFNKGFKYFLDLAPEPLPNKKIFRFFRYIKEIYNGTGVSRPWEDYYDELLKYVSSARKPYFLWVLLMDTHIPYIPPRRYRNYCNFISVCYSNWLAFQGPLWTFIEKLGRVVIDARNAYDDCIRYADEFIKRLWEDLKDDDPIFIIHGDHGEGFGEHGFYGHPPGYPVILYEEFTHVPLIIYNADVKGKVDYPVSLRQIPATIMDLIGEKSEFPSKSILREENDYVICKVFDRGRRKIAVRLKNWKFITGQKKENELYNLKKDPYEQENVIDEHPDLVKELRKIIQKHIKQELEIKKIRGVTRVIRLLGND